MTASLERTAGGASGFGVVVPVPVYVDDLDAMEELALELGAVKPDHQPGDGRWRVLLDPAGHPFCLTSA